MNKLIDQNIERKTLTLRRYEYRHFTAIMNNSRHAHDAILQSIRLRSLSLFPRDRQ